MKQKVYKWTKKDEDLVVKIIKEAKVQLNMQSWVIHNRFQGGTLGGTPMQGGMFIESACNTVTYEYEKMDIIWKSAILADIQDKQEEEIRECIYHELVHALTQV